MMCVACVKLTRRPCRFCLCLYWGRHVSVFWWEQVLLLRRCGMTHVFRVLMSMRFANTQRTGSAAMTVLMIALFVGSQRWRLQWIWPACVTFFFRPFPPVQFIDINVSLNERKRSLNRVNVRDFFDAFLTGSEVGKNASQLLVHESRRTKRVKCDDHKEPAKINW